MDKELLNKRINAINTKIDKINKRIIKHQNNQNEKAFIRYEAPWYTSEPEDIKTIDDLVNIRWKSTDSRYADDNKTYTIENTRKDIQDGYTHFINNEKEEVIRAQRDLKDNQNLLSKYQSELDKKDTFEKEEKVPVIWEFLQNYKKQVTAWIIANAKELHDLKENEDKNWQEYIQENDLQDVVKNHNDYWEKKKFTDDYYSGINSLTYEVYKYDGSVDNALLNKKLDADIELKYEYFIKQIKELAGEIVDAGGLNISPKGELNGIIHGTLNDVNVWTTLSGGAVQCYHYRTYVHIAK
jgi:hypothetical protein